MRFTFRIGRMVVFDFTLFEIDIPEFDDNTVVVQHHYVDEEDKPDDPGDLFGGNGK